MNFTSPWILLSVIAAVVGSTTTLAAGDGPLRVAPFQCDATPPVGHWLYSEPLETVEHPLLAKGIVLEQGENRYVLAAIDWCVLSGGAHTRLRQAMADGAGTDLARAAIHCTHVHTAPILDTEAKQLLAGVENPPRYYDPAFLDRVAGDLSAAVKTACARLEACDRIGAAEAKVERVASNRRIPVDGKIVWRGSSRGRKTALAELPEGVIDPNVKTITFARGEKPIVRLHYYATHPQSFYGDARASYDFPGMAREKLQEEEGVFQVYFTGCAGDVAAGKYNDGTREARQGLYERLLAGMRASAAATKYRPVGPIAWRTVGLVLPPKNVPGYNPEEFRRTLVDPKQDGSKRIWAARRVAFFERKQPIAISSLQIGDVSIVQLPGEPMLEFQRFAQAQRPDAFVAVAGYGDGCTSYICTDKAFEEGAYEPGASAVGPGSEKILKGAIRELLGFARTGE
ncbi:MAG: hypothetical protein HUU20_10435 [Pirellulales bacterium]|nr:hypothetical protein [Pirellulales bacterium]